MITLRSLALLKEGIQVQRRPDVILYWGAPPPPPSAAICGEYRELCKKQSRQKWDQAALSLARVRTNKSSSHFLSFCCSKKRSIISFQIT